jgi:serine/threonine protein kinase
MASSVDTPEDQEWSFWELDPSELRLESKVGSGVTADVLRAQWRGTTVAVKQLKWSGTLPPKLLQAFRRELSIMIKCRHPNLVLFMGAITRNPPLRLVAEFCEGGTVFDLVHNRPDVELTGKQKIKILIDLAKALNYLHAGKPPIIHRDVKSLNLLLAERVEDEFDTPIGKLADFGMSKIRASAVQDMTANAGTYHWMSPEVLGGRSYDEKVDCYSFAIVMYEVLFRRIPFVESGLDAMGIALAVNKGRRPEIPAPDQVAPELVKLMTDAWAQNPLDRPSMAAILDRLKNLKAVIRK